MPGMRESVPTGRNHQWRQHGAPLRRGARRAGPPAAHPKGRLIMEFPIRYWGWAYKGETCYRVVVTVATPGARTAQEWTNHAYASEAQARQDVERHNRLVGAITRAAKHFETKEGH